MIRVAEPLAEERRKYHPMYDLVLHSAEMLRLPVPGLIRNELLEQWIDLGHALLARSEEDLVAVLEAAREITRGRAPKRSRRARRRMAKRAAAAAAAAAPEPSR